MPVVPTLGNTVSGQDQWHRQEGGLGVLASTGLQATTNNSTIEVTTACLLHKHSFKPSLPAATFLQISTPKPSYQEILEMPLSMLRTQYPEDLK